MAEKTAKKTGGTKKKLVIVESPTKVDSVKKYLGSGYTIEATMGHVQDLPKSQLGIDIENGFEPKYITIRGKGDLMAKLKKAAKGYDEDRTEVKRLQALFDKATAELERLKSELKKQYQKARELLDLKNQTRLMKTVLKIPQEYDYKGVLSELNKQGYDFSGKKHKR